jgi:IclR family transcriptional regulator, acetate operon repressor
VFVTSTTPSSGARASEPARAPAPESAGDPPSSPTRAVERALALLSTVCTHDVTSLAAASRDTKVPASTALRLLRTMEREHFVVRDDDAGWRAGPRLLQLAVRSLAREPLARLARPALARLTAITGESAYLSVRGADGLAVHVAAGEGTYPVRYAAWVGHTLPLDGTAIGAALDGAVETAGFASVQPRGEPDVIQVAAPVRRPGGVVAALSVIGPAYRMDPANVRRLGEAVVTEARLLEAALGAASAPTAESAESAEDAAEPRPARPDQERAVAG